ncbi:uroporphyrinogen-III synthase [Luteimonas sp. A277]
MTPSDRPASALRGCYVISLRPVGEHAGMRRAAAVHGASTLALSPWRLVPRGEEALPALRQALGATIAIFTSPAAVHAAAGMVPLVPRSGQLRVAVGATTAAALRRAGVVEPLYPQRMDSEGLLGLPTLTNVAGLDIGLVTAPEGRSFLTESLQARGARVLRADVYDRVPVAPAPQALTRLRALSTGTPLVLALSSGLALEMLVDSLPADIIERLRGALVTAASARLVELALGLGFEKVVQGADARPASLLAAAASAAHQGNKRGANVAAITPETAR